MAEALQECLPRFPKIIETLHTGQREALGGLFSRDVITI